MKRKLIFSLVILIIGAGLYKKLGSSANTHSTPIINSSNDQSPKMTAESILKNDQERLNKNINTEILNDLSWKEINNYSIKPNMLVNSKNATHLFKIANKVVPDLVSCLKKDFCGMERRNENDSYFDERKTPAHILLERNLSIMLLSLKENPELKQEIDWNLVNELTENSNENIQVMAVELMANFNSDKIEEAKILKIVDEYKGDAKANALSKLAQSNPGANKSGLIDSIEKAFTNDDPNTVISVVEKLEKMNLTTDQLTKVAKKLCHYKENGTDDPNWKMIRYNMGKMKIDLDSTCS